MFSLLRRDSVGIPALLTFLLVGCWSELDLYAPSFPEMMHFYGTTEQMMQLTLSLNFLGFFLASLLCGPLADSFGRRKVIVCGTLIFGVGSLICVFASNIELMLLGRLIQGLGVSAPVTVCMAVIADIYEGQKQMTLITRMNSVITVTMALAPIVGVYLTKHLGWQSNFFAILSIAISGLLLVWLFLPETLDEKDRQPFNSKSLISGYWTLLTSKSFMFATLACCLAITPYFIFIGIMPLLFMESLGVSLNEYAFYQGSIVGLFSALSLCVSYLMRKFDTKKLIQISVLLSVLGLVMAVMASVFMKDNENLITIAMLVYTGSIVLAPTFMFSNAMQMHPTLKACASSMIQSVRMLSMALGTALAGAVYSGHFLPVALVMLFFMLASVPLTLYMMNRLAPMPKDGEALPAMH